MTTAAVATPAKQSITDTNDVAHCCRGGRQRILVWWRVRDERCSILCRRQRWNNSKFDGHTGAGVVSFRCVTVKSAIGYPKRVK